MSSATSLRQALNGCPARSARFMMSTASGSCSSNFSSRVLRSWMDDGERRRRRRRAPRAARPAGLPTTTSRRTNAAERPSSDRQAHEPMRQDRAARLLDEPSEPLHARQRLKPPLERRQFAQVLLPQQRRDLAVGLERRRSRAACARSSLCIRASEPNAGTNRPARAGTRPRRAAPERSRVRPSWLSPTACPRRPRTARPEGRCRAAQVGAGIPAPRRSAVSSPSTLPSLSTPVPLEREDLRHGDDVAFHAVDLLQADHAPAAVLVARDLEHDVDRRGHLRAQRPASGR